MSESSGEPGIDQKVREVVAVANAGDEEAKAKVQQLRRRRIVAAELTQSFLRIGLDSAIKTNPRKGPFERIDLLRAINDDICADDRINRELRNGYHLFEDRVDPEGYETILYDLTSLTQAAIGETEWLSLSAVSFAKKKGRRDLSVTAQHSTGMLEAARCDQTGIRKVREEVGYPINPAHLVMKATGNGLVVVEYGPDAMRLIQENLSPLGGCPAHHLPDTVSKPGTAVEGDHLIEGYWRGFTEFVLAGM